jgi:hypothetical protein
MITLGVKQAFRNWDLFKQNLLKETILIDETDEEKLIRFNHNLNDYESWFKFYFPNFYYSQPAPFHIAASKRLINNNNWYEVRAWARELAKSVRTMMEVLYLALNGRVKNIILISSTEESAINLLTPYRLNLEFNQRLINDYGNQIGLEWNDKRFITKNGVCFTAFGAGQNPRGNRNEEARVDVIIFDDMDTDEEVRNQDRINKKWDWIEQAVFFTVSTSRSKRIVFCGNIIGQDTCITRAIDSNPDHIDIINIRDKNGVSTWSAKNTEKDIDWMLSKVSYRSAQKEYFNNPISEGSIFKELSWGKIPDLSKFSFLLKYGDPSYSNRTTKKNSQKCVALIGKFGNKFYIINCRLEKETNAAFVKWYWDLDNDKKENVQVYNYVENNSLQDPYYSQVIKPEFEKHSLETGVTINPFSDDRKKPEKFARIEGNLEPINRDGNLIFNDKEKDNPHMKRLAEQFLCFSEKHISDGPDAVEGGIWIIENKLRKLRPIQSKSLHRNKNKKW